MMIIIFNKDGNMMIYNPPSYPTFLCQREREMRKRGVWVNIRKGEQWSSNQRALSVHPSVLEAKLKPWWTEAWEKSGLRSEVWGPLVQSAAWGLGTSPQGKNTASKRVTLTLLFSSCSQEKKGGNPTVSGSSMLSWKVPKLFILVQFPFSDHFSC